MTPNRSVLMRVADAVWLLALGLFVLAGAPLVSFHGDETNHVYNSRDYATAFIHGQPQDLVIDFSQPVSGYYLRIHDSSVARYSIGLAWHLAGVPESDLPSRGWNWQKTYNANMESGLRPSPPLLNAARLASALFLALSTSAMFALGWRFGQRPVAYLVSALYTLHPVILLNGRRALQEGPLLCFGLLTILIAAIISQKRAQGNYGLYRWWLALLFASGLTLASKNSGILYVASALGWIFVSDLLHFRWQGVVARTLWLACCGFVAVLLLIALSPGLWGDPISGLQKIVEVRLEQMRSHMRSVAAMTTLGQRVETMIRQPYMEPAAHFELSYWGEIPQIKAEIDQYMASPLSGLQFGVVLGAALTLIAMIGVFAMFWPRLGLNIPLSLSTGLLVWLSANVAALLLNPLPWQRYYISLIPVLTVLSAIGCWATVRAVRYYFASRRFSPTAHAAT